MSLRIAFQMDALSRLNEAFDSTLYIARAAAERGYELFHYEPAHLRMEITGQTPRILAAGHDLRFDGDKWGLGRERKEDLADFAVILMRQDPPFDLSYITATHILEHLKDKVRIVNDPIGVRNAPEKLVATHFPQLMPPTLIARDAAAIDDFRVTHGDIIIKPLHGYAGHGIFRIHAGDDNLPALIEMMGERNREPWMIQKFLPVATLGDKRIVLLNGDPVGVFRRIPPDGDVRGNMRIGAKAVASTLSKRDREICDTIAPALRERGLFLAGIDVIGEYLTEINVTSPTGLVVADQLEGRSGKDRISEQFWQKLLG